MSFLTDLHTLSFEDWLTRYDAPRNINEWMVLKANSALGYYASTPTTAVDAYGNVKLGEGALANLPAGDGGNNVAIGQSTLYNFIDGSDNVAVGEEAMVDVEIGSFNTALGDGAGSTAGVAEVTNGVFLGRNAKPLEDPSDNEIVLGANATGNGSNTTTIGNSATTHTFVNGIIILKSFAVVGLPAASSYAGGLVYVSNGTGDKRLAISDGTFWRYPDGNIVI